MNYYRDTWVEINLDNIAYNVKETVKLLPSKEKLFAVVKANAYGHGACAVAEAALGAGAHGLAVAFIDEALSLRKSAIAAPVLVLGASRPSDAGVAAEHHISLTVYQLEWLKQAQAYLSPEQTVKVHVKCDTGMGRLGVKTQEELKELVAFIDQSPQFIFEGLFTHFATADELDTAYFEDQLFKFTAMVESLEERPPYVHCANSAVSLRFKKAHFNAVRLGIAMYGLSPSDEIKPLLPFPLKPAFSLHTKIVHVKRMNKGEKVSYGATYEAQGDEWVATLPIGYADGWIRKLQGQEVLAAGCRVPIIGRICMDQCMIRLPYELPAGTTVTLIGRQCNEEITMDDIADRLATINYEVPCLITSRVPRVYKSKGEVLHIDNPLVR
ncbi:alanine racemase [Bacillus xiapuensis]|uniref:alanine racemase n=1 Tax=Bacillus xiapuensis TaxID=2014075 RepID=UPI000C2386A9|nr:alanine racemase [Bacillus xiapuensis]